jgi:hypothetical protein
MKLTSNVILFILTLGSISQAQGAPDRSEPAMQCVYIAQAASGGWAEMQNRCPHPITVSWCYTGTSDCKRGTWGYTNIGNIPAGGVRQASTFVGRADRQGLAYAACSGRDANIQETGPKTFVCK